MLDNIGFDIGFAVLVAVIGWVWHFFRRRAGIELSDPPRRSRPRRGWTRCLLS